MIDSAYQQSPLHKQPAGLKLAVLFIASIVLFTVPSLYLVLVVFILTWCLYPLAGFSWRKPGQQLFTVLWLLIALFLLQLLANSIANAVLVSLRLATLFLMACLVSLTTPAALMLETFERLFSFVKYIGGNPAKISLALSLTLRFIPLFQEITRDVREAQKARGMEHNFIALLIPILVRTLKMQDDVANAIEARCYDSKSHK